MNKIYLTLVLFVSISISAMGQKVTGEITDASTGETLPGVSVLFKGSSIGAIADTDGNYLVEVDNLTGTLVFSCIGYEEQEILINGRTIIDVQLSLDNQFLDEAVVVGYGSMRKNDLTGAVSSISSEKLLSAPSFSLGQALTGKVAGMSVTTYSGRPGGESKVRIRGSGSINSSNDPLYVVNGVIGMTLSDITPNEIESIEILKDASSVAIYGARGANGVIMITTKQGTKDGKISVTYDGYVSVATPSKKLDLLDAEGWLEADAMAVWNTTNLYGGKGHIKGKRYDDIIDENGDPIYDTDWQDAVLRPAFGMNHQVGVRGGNEKFSMGMFAGFSDTQGIVETTYYKRYSGRLTAEANPVKWLSFNGDLSFNSSKEKRHDMRSSGTGGIDVVRAMIQANPLTPIKYPDGTWAKDNDFYSDIEGRYNPVRALELTDDIWLKDVINGSLAATVRFTPNLEFKSNVGFNIVNTKNNLYTGIAKAAKENGKARIRTWRRQYWQNENYLVWNKTIADKHRINLMGGASWQEQYVETMSVTAQNFPSDQFGWHNLAQASDWLQPVNGDSEWSINSFFARANYAFDDRYLLTITGRADGSSRFGANNKYAFFPSAAFAWRISEEKFMQNQSWVSNLKLRLSWGITGNTEIGTYKTIPTLGTNTPIFDDTPFIGNMQGNLPNADLRWEQTTQYDMGVDWGIIDNRINLSFDLYYKLTDDLLFNAPVPHSTGYSTILKNIGAVENKGVEFTVSAVAIDRKDFRWDMSFNFTYNKNKVVRLANDNADIIQDMYLIRVGEPLGAFYGNKFIGVWQENDPLLGVYKAIPGDAKYLDLQKEGEKGYGVIDLEDRVVMGQGIPPIFGAFNTSFIYKGFDLGLTLRYALGNQIFANQDKVMMNRGTTNNMWSSALDSWTPENPNNDRPAIRLKSAKNAQIGNASNSISSGSFLRGEEITLGYSFSSSLLEKIKIDRFRLYLTAQNFFVISDYYGYDPELIRQDSKEFSQGVDDFQYPKAMTFTFGINLSF